MPEIIEFEDVVYFLKKHLKYPHSKKAKQQFEVIRDCFIIYNTVRNGS